MSKEITIELLNDTEFIDNLRKLITKSDEDKDELIKKLKEELKQKTQKIEELEKKYIDDIDIKKIDEYQKYIIDLKAENSKLTIDSKDAKYYKTELNNYKKYVIDLEIKHKIEKDKIMKEKKQPLTYEQMYV
jgi:hypothetical protein